MRAWDELERRRAAGPDPETLAELEARGIELDPLPEGHHRHGETTHPSDHEHPHQRSGPDERPSIGIVGAGAVGTALGVGLARAGWPIDAVASRDPDRRARFRELVGPGVKPFAEATAVVDEVELIILAVPDDVLGPLAGELRMYSGQAMVHTSGAWGAEVLEPAMAAGTQIGGFHPLVSFADVERSVAALAGATIAIEGDDQLVELLDRIAESLGATAVRLRSGTKPAYHAAAVLAAGGLVALLDAIVELGRVAGLDEPGALAVYGRLVEQTLTNARVIGVAEALTGPTTRGDIGTFHRHMEALSVHAPGVLPLYRATAAREVDIAEARGAIATETAEALRRALAPPP
jgi:predicted short-subunit dehydrogenase-like oxidoreductase (DUF2520 family)